MAGSDGRLGNSNFKTSGPTFPAKEPSPRWFICQGATFMWLPAMSALRSAPEMVTTQVAPDSESTCGTAVCIVSLNTNLSNLTNRAG